MGSRATHIGYTCPAQFQRVEDAPGEPAVGKAAPSKYHREGGYLGPRALHSAREPPAPTFAGEFNSNASRGIIGISSCAARSRDGRPSHRRNARVIRLRRRAHYPSRDQALPATPLLKSELSMSFTSATISATQQSVAYNHLLQSMAACTHLGTECCHIRIQ